MLHVHEILADVERECAHLRDCGHTPENADAYVDGELLLASGAYVLAPLIRDDPGDAVDVATPPEGYPWPADSWKPTTSREDLVRAMALIVTEIQRRDRLGGDDA